MITYSNQRKSWYAVAYSTQLKKLPLAIKLLEEPIVLWRDAENKVCAVKDLCIHRGTALSLGSCIAGEIVCPYHGWRYNAQGKCTLIPQLEDPKRIPKKAAVEAYNTCERYGLIWLALEEPSYPLPEVPELESADWLTIPTGPFKWKSAAGRQVENFTDFGHFPFVHPGLLGDQARTVVPNYEVSRKENVLYYNIVRPEAVNSEEFPVFSNPDTQAPVRRSFYQLYMPYTIVLRTGWGGREGMVYFFTSQPVSQTECIGYCIVARNYNFEQPADVIRDFEQVIFDQDKRIVESQRPEQVPFDLAEELHLKFDAVAVQYRKAMKELGFAI